MIGSKTLMNYMAHRLGVRELTREDIERLESGNYDKTMVDSRDYFEGAKNTEQANQPDSGE